MHIPRTAGTSVESLFLDDLGLDSVDKNILLLGKSNKRKINPRVLSHLTAEEMIAQKYISKDQFDVFFKFSIVRNPIDRLISIYKFLGFESVVTFDIFIKYVLKKLMFYKKYSYFLQTQTTFLYDREDNLNLMDIIIKFENLDEGFKVIYNKLNNPSTKLKHKNKGNINWDLLRGIKKIIEHPILFTKINLSKKKTLKLSQRAKKIIWDLYGIDFVNFNYKLKY